MIASNTRTKEEQILDKYTNILKLSKALDSIILPDEVFRYPFPTNQSHGPLIDRLTKSFELRKLTTGQVAVRTGIDMVLLKKFIETELKKSGEFVMLNLMSLSEAKVEEASSLLVSHT